VARWVRFGLSVVGPLGCRCLTIRTMLRFHIPLVEPDRPVSGIRLSEKAHAIAVAIACEAVCNFSRELPVDPHAIHRWDFPCYAWSTLPTCRRQYPDRFDGTCSLVPFHQLRPSLHLRRVGSCISGFEACTAFPLLRPACSPSRHSDPLHQRLQQLRCLRCCSDCYRVERTSSRAGIPPLSFRACGP